MPYEILLHRKVQRYLVRNHTLRELWESRREALILNPRQGQGIRHLTDLFICNYRLRLDVWRILYEVSDESQLISVYRARLRDDAYDP